MKDPYGRETKGLRISVTSRCNLRCIYCHNEGQGRMCPSFGLGEFARGGGDGSGNEKMTAGEIGRIVEAASNIGIEEVKLTGGEPLMREDIGEVVKECKKWVGEVSMTTNGVLLSNMAEELKESGLDRVNVSLDTLDRTEYTRLTGVDALDRVVEGILAAIDVGLNPVKVNLVALPDFTVEDILKTIEGVWSMGAIAQVIEYVDNEMEDVNEMEEVVRDVGAVGPIDVVENMISQRAVEVVERRMHRRSIYVLEGGSVEFVRPMHNSMFCANCTRLRVTADGVLKPCLMHNKGLVDILSLIRDGRGIDVLESAVLEAIGNRKPYWNHMNHIKYKYYI